MDRSNHHASRLALAGPKKCHSSGYRRSRPLQRYLNGRAVLVVQASYFEPNSENTDLSMVQWPYADHDDKSARPLEYFDCPVQVHDDLWIGMLDEQLTEWILEATEQRGRRWKPNRQYDGGYAFIRSPAPDPKPEQRDFDPDNRLRTLIALSRLVHPTSIAYAHAVRIWTYGGPRDDWKIAPHHEPDVGSHAFVLDVHENWLIPGDVSEMARLLHAWDGGGVPRRVGNALWHLEMAARNYFVNLRFPIIVTALESLVKIRNEKNKNGGRLGSTKAFVGRLIQVGNRDGILDVGEEELEAIYATRSDLVHALRFVDLDDETRALYRQAETMLRRIIRKALLDEDFADLFVSDEALAAAFPL